MTPQEKLFAQIAIRKNYITQAMVEKALLLKNQYSQQGYSVSLPQILLQSKSLSTQQMQDIEVEYKFRTSTIPPLNSPSSSNELNNNRVSNANSNTSSPKPPISVIGSNEESANVAPRSSISAIGSNEESPNVVSSRPPISAIASHKTGISAGTSPEIVVPDQTKQFKPGDKTFNHYNIGKELGRGGMGVVYKVYDTKLKRTVALKLLLSKQVSEVQQERFRREAEAMAQLEHSNIIKVYEVGELPQMFLTMEYISGQTFLDHILQNTMDLKKRLEVMRDTALAIHFIHKRGYIHRDIKPANIMINENKQPKVMDFGLVKFDDSNLSKTSDVLGTPVFMPPEQLGTGKVDRRSDVYSLGASLYQALTGRPPFQGDTAFNIMYQITTKEPISLQELNPDIPPQLEAICLKCLEKKMHYRYATAKEFADDITNYLCGKPIIARPPTRMERTRKWIRNNKLPSFIFLVITFLLILSAILGRAAQKQTKIAHENFVKAQKQTKIAQDQTKIAQDQTKKAHKSRYDLTVTLFNEYLKKDNINSIKTQIESQKDDSSVTSYIQGLKNWEWGWIRDATLGLNFKILARGSGNSFCAFGKGRYQKYVAVCGGGMNAGYLALIDITTNKFYRLKITHKAKFCDFTNNGEYLLSGGEDLILRLWSVKTKSLLKYFEDGRDAKNGRPISHVDEINCCRFSQNGKYVVSGGNDDEVKLWSVKTGKKIKSFPTPRRIELCCFLDNDTKVLAVLANGVVTIWDIKTDKKFSVRSLPILDVVDCHIGRLGKNQVIVLCGEKQLHVWKIRDLTTKNALPIFSLTAKQEFTSTKIFQQRLFVTDNNILSIWDLKTKTLVKSLFNDKNITQIALHNNGRDLITLSIEGIVQLWNLNYQRPIKLNRSENNKYISFAKFVKQDAQILFGEYNKVSVFNIPEKHIKVPEKVTRENFKELLRLDPVTDGDISGKYRVSTGQKSLLTVSDIVSDEVIEAKETETRSVTKCRFSPINPNEIAATGKNIIFIWQMQNKKLNLVFRKKIRELLKNKVRNPDGRHITYRTDGKQIAIASESYEILFLDPEKRVLDYSLYIEEDLKRKPRITHCTYSRDGKKLAVCSEKKTVMVYFLNEKTKRFERNNRIVLRGHYQEVLCSSFSPDGKRLISGGNDKQLLLWNVDFNSVKDIKPHNYLPLLTLDTHNKGIINCQFSANGKRILSADKETIYIWDVTGW
ncbi:protein kinase [Candidatus Uabimicrobium sp. HlEnr_7]|uniref:protein kinase domain-containing protein n=1 Tax=Candidatus Uabimicrobium helgolandensis TaxID=3095367 RepID=UPI0035566B74